MPGDCSTCAKTAARIEAMREEEDWECSHVECPRRRKCWSGGVRAATHEQQFPPRDGIEKLFDSAEA